MREAIVDLQREDLTIHLLLTADTDQNQSILVQEILSLIISQLDTLILISLRLILRSLRIEHTIANPILKQLHVLLIEAILIDGLGTLSRIHIGSVQALQECLRGLPSRSDIASLALGHKLCTEDTPRQSQLGRTIALQLTTHNLCNRTGNALLKTSSQRGSEVLEVVVLLRHESLDRNFHFKILLKIFYCSYFVHILP